MRDLDQTIIKFDYNKDFKNEDFYLSKSNKHVFDFLNIWPKWEKNFVNVIGEKLSGKTHLMNIFLRKNKGVIFDGKSLRNSDLKKIKIYENVIIENLYRSWVEVSFLNSIFAEKTLSSELKRESFSSLSFFHTDTNFQFPISEFNPIPLP